MKVDPELLTYATPRQREVAEALEKYGSTRKAATAMGVHHSYVDHTMGHLRRRAALSGYAPEAGMTKVVPAPFIVRGASTLYDEDGKPRLQWVKSRLDDRQVEAAIRETIDLLCEGVPRVQATPAPENVAHKLLNQLTLTDCHVGMRAWHRETGEDWDLTIAEELLVRAARHLLYACPKAETAIVAELGDFLHYDGMSPVTPQHGNVLDADGRYPKVVAVAVRALRRIVSIALERHKFVVFLVAEGNHDMASSVWLQHLFGLLFENEPRVKVIQSPCPYYAHQHGKVMLGFHHGHLSKNAALPLLMATMFPSMWGETRWRYCHTGHYHHIDEKEHNGMLVIQHPTIAAKDAYATRGGWLPNRTLTTITYHADYGQVARNTLVPEMLEEK